MNIDILTACPGMFDSFIYSTLVKRSIATGFVKIIIHDLHIYGIGKHRKIDDYPYGGGGGMVLRIEPIYTCLTKLLSLARYDDIIYMSPHGDIFNQNIANIMSKKKKIIIICGRCKGVDQRVIDHFVTKQLSIGKYVISGGEIASMVFIDAILRIIPGIICNQNSILTDSYQRYTNFTLSAPVYTRPKIFNNLEVPKILLSGNHDKIQEWKKNYFSCESDI
jgi:tRNA (guanine37-N1)-methyltransferase